MSERKEETVAKQLIKHWLPKIKTKLIEQEVINLSNIELKRAFKGTVAENRLIKYAKLLIKSGNLKYNELVQHIDELINITRRDSKAEKLNGIRQRIANLKILIKKEDDS